MTILEQHYSKHKEEHRLETRHGRVEFEVSMSFIKKACKKNAGDLSGRVPKILDIGAGTGRYSIALAEDGYDVTAVELVKHNLEILRSKHKNVKTWQGNALNLSFLKNETFDITILFGPLYHLHTQKEKLAALNEARRVTKKGGVIFAGYIMNEYSVIQYCFKNRHILESIKNGTLTQDFKVLTGEKDIYSYIRLEEISELNSLAGLKRQFIFASDGAADYMRKELNALSEEEFKIFIQYQLAVCCRNELLGSSSHVVDVLCV
ncbi:MAG: class I SAM-dependent methyltransferase [Treponemataceae bacterium]